MTASSTPTKPFTISPATPSDAKHILTLIKGLADYENLSHAVTATESILHKNIFENKYAQVLLVHHTQHPSSPVAFALYFHNFSTFLGKPGIYLEDLFVMPEFRGQGIGKALLGTLGKIAKEKECGRVEWSCLDWNASARGFYESLGAEHLKEWIIYRVAGDGLDKLAAM